ncbi:MAG TPA: RluA family pseudouridine synthase [Caulobacteraceae bacterium]|nr:RluA family pseudouridine synthase [Caulobacteraceae bacterium]
MRVRREVALVVVEPDEAGLRLDRWLRRRWPALVQSRIEKLARTGQIRVDGARVRADARLAAGARVRVPPLLEPEPGPVEPHRLSAAEIAFARSLVLYEDADVLALNKPSGLATQGGTSTARHLDRLLWAFGEGARRPRLVHRLDKATSGVLVVGKTPGAAARLAASFASREAIKTYWAIVAGVPQPREGVVDRPLVKARGPRGEKMDTAQPGDPAAQPAITRYAVLQESGRAAFVALRPLTGRTHQLRAHMALLGHPILGDRKYGTPGSVELSGTLRLQLHARALSVPNPRGGVLELTAPPSEALCSGFRRFGFDAAIASADPFGDSEP